jgi:endonuclease-3
MVAAADWKAPPPRRLRTILQRLAGAYGRTHGVPHHAPVDELVLTVLSQNTNDRNRDVAYERLRDRFESWEEVRQAPEEEVVEAIRPGGLAPSKAPRIRTILESLDGDDLARMEHEPLPAARAELCDLPGVGRKTAACVLLFAFGRHDVPVDTHVHRVGTRLGLFRPGAPLEECHDEMLRLSTGQDPYESHMALIRHGRRLCGARAPRCEECPLLRMCPYARGEQ